MTRRILGRSDFFEDGFCGICWKNGGLLWCFGGYLAVKSVGSVVCCAPILVVGGGFAGYFEGADEEEDGDGEEGDPAD